MVRALTLVLLLALASAGRAHAQEERAALEFSAVSPQQFSQVVYKGLIGNVLEAVPMEPVERIRLQRASAVVSGTWFGRSLAVVAGISNPFLLLGGFAWGVWSASNINSKEPRLDLAANPGESGAGSAAQSRELALAPAPLDRADVPLVAMHTVAVAQAPAFQRPRVFKVWLPQRSGAPLR